jgi:hypothetical protein
LKAGSKQDRHAGEPSGISALLSDN